jgi:ATP/maltotriose-dependent transcriptional regulator MalT
MSVHLPRGRPTDNSKVSFVGRKPELVFLRGQLNRARAGEPRLVLVEGPAGIGKTALVCHFLAHAGAVCVLRASGEEAEASLAFGVLAQLIGHDTNVPAGPLTHLRGTGQRPADPLAAGAALVDLLGELQHDRPVVVVLDDAHLADSPSLQAFTFALRRLRVDRLLVLLVTREGTDPRLPEGLRRVLAGDHGVRLRLAGLDAAELGTLGAQLGVGRLPRRAAERLHDHTGGNPLYARALLEELDAETLRDADVPLPAPRSFALLVLARLARCPVETQELVAAASVLGRSCPLHLAAQLAGLEDPLPALEQATATRLLKAEPTSGIRLIAFPHPLVHAAVYQDLGPVRRVRLHTQAAALVDLDAGRLRHLLRAANGPDPQLAAELATSARRHAAAGLWGIAAEQLTAAARLLGVGHEQNRLMVEAVDALLLDGRVDEATALAATLADSADPAARNYVHGRLTFMRGRLPEARALLTKAWEHCDRSAEPVLAARIAGQLASLSLLVAHGTDAANWASRALRLTPDRTATDLVRYIQLNGLGITGSIHQALALVAALPDPAAASLADMDGLLVRGVLRTWADDLAGAHRDLTGVVNACRDRSVPFRLVASALLGQVEYRLGRWDDAEIHLDLAISIGEDADQAWLTPQTRGLAALVPAARGQWERATTHLHAAYESTPHQEHVVAQAYTASGHAHLATARGDANEVVTVLRPLLELESHDGTYEPGVLPWQDLLVEALVALGEYDQAEAVLVPFASLAADRGRHSTLAAAARARGQLQAARRDAVGAAAAFQAGQEHAAQVAMPFERARLELAYGAFLRRVGKRALAADQLEAARATLQRLEARPYLERCERELAACGRLLVTRRRYDLTRLTVQELAAAQLAAQGLTNRQIARELVVSVKTVEYHLGHVYAKLQVTSRVQLASLLTKTRDVPRSVPEATGEGQPLGSGEEVDAGRLRALHRGASPQRRRGRRRGHP